MGGMFWLSSTPGKDLPSITIPFFDKIAHGVEFLIFGALVFRAQTRSHPGMRVSRAAIISVCLALTYAAFDEWHQRFIPDRQVDLSDFLANVAGITVGIFLYYRYIQKEIPRGSDKAF